MKTATHKHVTAAGVTYYKAENGIVYEWNHLCWAEVFMRCTAEDFLSHMQLIDEPNKYPQMQGFSCATMQHDNQIYPRKNVSGAWQGD